MFEANTIWSSDKKMKITTGLTLEEATFIFKDFEVILEEKKKN